MTKKQKKMLYRILAAAVLFLAAKLIPLPMLVSAALYFAAYLTVGCDILRKAWKGICNRQGFDENFLMAVATVGAIALALYERSGDYSEAVAVMLFYQIGELFQSYAVGKSRRSITALMDIRATVSSSRSTPTTSRSARPSLSSRVKRCPSTAWSRTASPRSTPPR